MTLRTSIILGITSGLLLVLSLPKPDLHPLAWIALTPLLVSVAQSRTWRQAATASYAAGVVYFGGTCYWVAETMILYGGLGSIAAAAVALLFFVVFALHFALFGGVLFHVTHGGYPARLLFAAPVWVVLELIRTYAPFGGFPWMLSGYALVPYTGVLQLAAWTGIYGLSFLATTVNCIFALSVLRRSVLWAAIGIAAVVIAFLLPVTGESAGGEPLLTRLVQANVAFEQTWDPPESTRLLDELERLSVPTQPGALIVWPETPGPFFLTRDPEFRERMQRIASENVSHFVFGYIGITGDAPTNSAAMLDPRGTILTRYDKIHLVPFGEYVPLRNLLFFAESLLEEVGTFAAGTDYTLGRINGHTMATVICYESIFPGQVREFVKRGSELIVVITNDGWFGKSSAPYQHLRMGIVRAVENRRYVVRAANTGITTIIDPYGRIDRQTPMNVRTVLDGVVRFRQDRTFYNRYGDVFAYLNAGVLFIALAWKRR